MKPSVALMVLWASGAALAQDANRFSDFHDQGIFDEAMPNEAANALVAEGIASDEPAVVEMTIRALGAYAPYVAHNAPRGPNGRALPRRTFHEVDGLKAFLMAYWDREYASHGYNFHAEASVSVGEAPSVTAPSVDSEPPDVEKEFKEALASLATELGVEDPEKASFEEVMLAYAKTLPAWQMIPQVLCTVWSKDGEVLQFIWDFDAKDRSPNVSLTTLSLLNLGRFDTEAADAFRLQALSRLGGRDGHVATLFAAEGLALAKRPEALAPLIAAAIEHPSAINEVLMTLAGYSEEELAPHAAELSKLLPRTPRGVNTSQALPKALQDELDAESDAWDKLEAVVGEANR